MRAYVGEFIKKNKSIIERRCAHETDIEFFFFFLTFFLSEKHTMIVRVAIRVADVYRPRAFYEKQNTTTTTTTTTTHTSYYSFCVNSI